MDRAGQTRDDGSAPVLPAVLLLAVVVGAHAGTIALARAISRSTTEGVPLWAAAGVTASVLLLAPRRLWPAVLAVTFATNVIGNRIIDIPLDTAAGGALANTVEPLLGALAVQRVLGTVPSLSDRRHLLAFLGGACAGGPAVGALIGTLSIELAPSHPPFADVLGRWFVGDALGVLVVGSFVLAWWRPVVLRRATLYAIAEAIAALTAIIGLALLAFWGSSPVLAYIVLPPLGFTAIRFGTRGATLGGLAVAVIADWATIRGHGLFVALLGKGEHEALWQLQLFLAVLLMASLVLAVQVNELAAAQRALRVNEERDRIAALLESSPDPILVVRPDSTVEYANEQMLAMIRRTRDELMGRPFVQFINKDRRDAVLDVLEHMRRQPVGTRETFEMVGLGEVLDRALEAALSPIDTLDGIVLVTTVRDVTERKEAEAALRAARDAAESATAAKTEFLATMSHEIRTPMSAVTNIIELLGQSTLDADQRALLATMRDSSSTLLRIIDDTLDLSKIEAGKLEIEVAPFALDDELQTITALMTPAAIAKGVTLTSSIDPRVPTNLLGDPLRIRQIVLNLVSNAIKFTDAGSVDIDVRLGPDEGPDRVAVVLQVRDTGIGIEPERQTALFRPFTQAELDTARRFGGTGLGLSIVRRLIDLMHGTITVTSARGAGSTFTVTLPLAATHVPAERDDAGSAPIDPTRFTGHVVLVADDNAVNRDVLVRQLALVGCGADAVGDGHEALERLAAGGISLVLTDCNMPILDGFEVAQEIRRREATDGGLRVPIVAVTATAMAGHAERCLAAGMDAVLTKPVAIAQLSGVLADLLPPHPPHTASSLDLAVLREIIGDDERAVVHALETFGSVVGTATDAARHAIATNDPARARDPAHTIVGAARSVGAARLAALARVVELAATAGSSDVLGPALDSVIGETEAISSQVALLAADE